MPLVVLLRYLVTPCVTLITVILLNSRVRGTTIQLCSASSILKRIVVLFWPLVLIPLIQVAWGLVDSGAFAGCFKKNAQDQRSLLRDEENEGYVTFSGSS